MRRFHRILISSLALITTFCAVAGAQTRRGDAAPLPPPAEQTRPRVVTPQQKAKPAPAGARAAAPAVALFAVSRNRSEAYLDPVAIFDRGRLAAPPSGAEDGAALARFAGRYYRAGQKYPLLFGGGRSGTATVQSWLGREGECNRSMAAVRLDAEAKIDGKVMGLATNAETLGRRPSSRRPPTAVERAAALKLAQAAFRQRGVATPLLATIRQINLTAMDLNGDGKFELIGSYSTRAKNGLIGHTLFLIAEPRATVYRAALARYAKLTKADLMAGATLNDLEDYVLAEILVDQVDLDGDKQAEVVVMRRGFEGVAYRIYKRQPAGWRRAFESYSYKCAY